MQDKLELLMPAGNLEKLKFAFAYWADAVYVWIPMFSLRARTNEFTLEWLKEAVNYTRKLSWNKKIYFTANIYAHNLKIEPFLKQFEKMQKLKPDAFIMADPWLINIIRKKYPDLIIHLSVQANNTNWAQVEFWKNIWIKRIILSREISIKEIKEIHEKVLDIELEAFVHGAICMAYSWRCLISNYLSNRDSNQWTCSHSCRWQYKVFKNDLDENALETATGRVKDYKELTWNYYLEEKERRGELMEIDEDEYWTYLMNSRDLMAIDYIKELKDAWIISFKVEWRNKTVNYLASTWIAYGKAIRSVEKWKDYDSKKLSEELFSIANRGYIPWFLAWNPWKNAQFYEKNWTFWTKVFCWIVRWYDNKNKLARIEVKNKFDKWDKIEFLSPNWNFTEKVNDIYKIDIINHSTWKKIKLWENFDKKIVSEEKSAHWWGYEVWINCSKNPWEFAIIRKNLN